jgi:hypothetical protein
MIVATLPEIMKQLHIEGVVDIIDNAVGEEGIGMQVFESFAEVIILRCVEVCNKEYGENF